MQITKTLLTWKVLWLPEESTESLNEEPKSKPYSTRKLHLVRVSGVSGTKTVPPVVR